MSRPRRIARSVVVVAALLAALWVLRAVSESHGLRWGVASTRVVH